MSSLPRTDTILKHIQTKCLQAFVSKRTSVNQSRAKERGIGQGIPENGTSLSMVGPQPRHRESQPSFTTEERITALSSL